VGKNPSGINAGVLLPQVLLTAPISVWVILARQLFDGCCAIINKNWQHFVFQKLPQLILIGSLLMVIVSL
jgi:hypothetical protein